MIKNIMMVIFSIKGITAMSVIIVLSLKLFINREATQLQIKKTVVSIPSQITFLVIGFLFSDLLADTEKEHTIFIVGAIILSFIVLIFLYAVENYLEDRLSGSLGWKKSIGIFGMYLTSIVIYIFVVLGGIYK